MSILPAGDGDCLLLTWGGTGALRHAVIDGGRAATYLALRPRLEVIAVAGEPLELLVLTHVDADHIEGALRYVNDPNHNIVPARVWYNSFEAMGGFGLRSIGQGDRYAEAIGRLGWPLNAGSAEGLVSVETAAPLDTVPGLGVTVLGPDARGVAAMLAKWADWRNDNDPLQSLRSAGLFHPPRADTIDVDALYAPSKTDTERPNGSSIALLIEYDGRRVLLAGDAHPEKLVRSIAPMAEAAGGRIRVDLFKVSHHGSRGNVTRKPIELQDCRRFAISTDGTRHGHPDPEAISRLLASAPAGPRELLFNYATARTQLWNDPELRRRWTMNAGSEIRTARSTWTSDMPDFRIGSVPPTSAPEIACE